MQEHDIPADLAINWDKTGIKLVPVNSWMLAEQRSKEVSVVGKDDKREVTPLLVVSVSGDLPPRQVIYAGKTNACHPNVNFPAEWHITHSPLHWSTEETMLQYIDSEVVPYFMKQRQKLELSATQPALAIFDAFTSRKISFPGSYIQC